MCMCCPLGAGHTMNALVEKELAEAEAANQDGLFDIGDITTAQICGTEDDGEKVAGSTEKLDETKSDKQSNSKEKDGGVGMGDSAMGRIILPTLKNKDRENRDSRVLFTIPSETEETEESENGKKENTDDTEVCKCPCHVAQQVYDDLMSQHSDMIDDDQPVMFNAQTSVQGNSLQDLNGWTDESNTAVETEPDYGTTPDSYISTMDQAVQVGPGMEDADDWYHPPYSYSRGRQRQISRATSVNERRPPYLYSRTYSIYDRNRLTSGGDARDRSRTISSDDFTQSAGPRLLQRGLSRQQSRFQAKCKEKEAKEKERDKDRDNANRLSVKDHEHFSVSIDDLNAATEQYFRDSEDNAALKTTLITPTEDPDSVFLSNDNLKDAKPADVTINVEDV